MTQPPYGQQPGGPYPPPYQAPPAQPPYQYGPPSVAPQQGQSFGWGPQFAPPPPGGPGGYPPGPGYPGPGFQPGWQPQMPPKKRSKGPLFAILGFCLLAVVGLWTFGVMQKNADDDYTQPTITEPSYRATSPAPSPTETEPTATETSGPTQAPTTTKPTPPPPSDLDVLTKNSLYRTGAQRTVNCREPNIRPSTNGNAARYWAALKPCLDRAWARQIALAKQDFRAPGMLYWSGTNVTSPCSGGVPTVPFYCSTNHMMYMKVDNFVKSYNQYSDAESKAYARMWYTRSIAHEYGHAVQSITGILEASHRLRYEASSYDNKILMTRRTELQANCFAGVFLAANKRSYPIDRLMLRVWNKWVVTAGDPPGKGTHGSAASQARFMGRSFVTANPATCNTFTASRANVN